jgi:hypothetical protein
VKTLLGHILLIDGRPATWDRRGFCLYAANRVTMFKNSREEGANNG